MTQVSPAPSITVTAPSRSSPKGNGADAGFSLALAGPKAPAQPATRAPARPAPDPREVDSKRHAVAEGGKELPDQEESAADGDEEKTEADAAFAWFGAVLPPPAAAPPIGGFGQPAAGVTLTGGEGAPATAAALLAGLTEGTGEAAPAPALVGKGVVQFRLTDVEAVAPQAEQIEGIDINSVGRTDLPARVEIAAKIELPADSPMLRTIAALQPKGESQSLAALAASAGIELPEQFRRPAARETTTITSLTPQTGATEMLRPQAVQSVANAQQAVIDTRRAEWMNQTIDRIEALRDSPNSRETSIRLSPDALGTVDVSIRQEGDRVHVRFAAENAQARTLLTEAQSRLTEIAEARGIKLGQTTVDNGAAGQGQRQDAAPRTTTNTMNLAPASALGSATTANTDARVA